MSYYDQADTFYEDYDYALAYAAAKKDPCSSDADCENNPAGALGEIACKTGKGIKKHITGECTALDPKKIDAEDKKKGDVLGLTKASDNVPSSKDPDADCNSWLIFKPLCVAGKSITKGGQGLGAFFQNPTTWVMLAAAVIIFIVIILKVKL